MFRLFRFTRRLVLLALLLLAAAAAFVYAGHMLVDPASTASPAKADAIVVLAGTDTERWLEAYDLWRDGVAPVIIIGRGYAEAGTRALAARGARMPNRAELARDVMISQLDVPPDAVELGPVENDNTAAEAVMTRDLAVARGWRRVIVVTSLPHTRRAAYVMERHLAPAGVDVQLRASRYGDFTPSGWWRSRSNWRWILLEMPKLLAYRLGLDE